MDKNDLDIMVCLEVHYNLCFPGDYPIKGNAITNNKQNNKVHLAFAVDEESALPLVLVSGEISPFRMRSNSFIIQFKAGNLNFLYNIRAKKSKLILFFMI